MASELWLRACSRASICCSYFRRAAQCALFAAAARLPLGVEARVALLLGVDPLIYIYIYIYIYIFIYLFIVCFANAGTNTM